MKKLISMISIFIFTAFLPFNLNADYIDKLLTQADNIRSSDPSEFHNLLTKLAQKKTELTLEQKAYYQYLYAYKLSFIGDFKQAVDVYNAILANQQHSASIRFRTHLSLVNIFAIAKNWNEGLKHLLISQQLLPQINQTEFKHMSMLISAVFYNQIGQYTLGLNYAKKLQADVSKSREQCMGKYLEIEAKFRLNELTISDAIFDNAIALCKEMNESVVLAGVYTTKANIFINNTHYADAITLLSSQQSLVEATKYPPYIAYFYSLLAQAHFSLNQTQQAQNYALNAIKFTQSLGSSEPSVIANKVLYLIAEKNNDMSAALSYFKQYAEADKAYLNGIKAKHLAFQLAQHRASEQRSHIEWLSQQNNLLLLKQKFDKVEAENNQLFITLLIVCITLLSAFIYRSKTTQTKLRHLAQNDGLTGLFNRRHFTQEANRAINKCIKSQHPGSCILFDLDKFKSINDTYGHKTGDWVLKNVANTCKPIVRTVDILARIGGEEFCVFLPNCSKADALVIAEEYRHQLNQINTADTGFEFTISGSFGVSDFTTSGHSLEKLIADADSAMYDAKTSGRNRVCLFK
ncbi:diguanylate cyclase [Shewanella intestini]|uniref:diguanylate cyclase n=1 Tax=Shewanella intestini TaxID=2017544 RepID=A0ABS5I3E1_9GAMM|nr:MULTISPECIES: GGDEF domain-containing protein [Shewanella]MBR9728529.1 GGDEF domain-containing protein [Shewanella intestini]